MSNLQHRLHEEWVPLSFELLLTDYNYYDVIILKYERVGKDSSIDLDREILYCWVDENCCKDTKLSIKDLTMFGAV